MRANLGAVQRRHPIRHERARAIEHRRRPDTNPAARGPIGEDRPELLKLRLAKVMCWQRMRMRLVARIRRF